MNIKKLLISIVIVLIITTVFYISKTYAISNIINDGNSFIRASDNEDDPIKEEELKPISSKIYNILLGIGIVVAVLVGAFLGIQFLYAGAEGKAKIMEALVPYVVGCVVVFGAFTIWEFAINTGNSVSHTNGSTTGGREAVTLTCPNCGAEVRLNLNQQSRLERGFTVRLSCCGYVYSLE